MLLYCNLNDKKKCSKVLNFILIEIFLTMNFIFVSF